MLRDQGALRVPHQLLQDQLAQEVLQDREAPRELGSQGVEVKLDLRGQEAPQVLGPQVPLVLRVLKE